MREAREKDKADIVPTPSFVPASLGNWEAYIFYYMCKIEKGNIERKLAVQLRNLFPSTNGSHMKVGKEDVEIENQESIVVTSKLLSYEPCC